MTESANPFTHRYQRTCTSCRVSFTSRSLALFCDPCHLARVRADLRDFSDYEVLVGRDPNASSLGGVKALLYAQAARDQFEAEQHALTWREPPSHGSLANELALPEVGPTWRVEGLLGAGENAILVAGRKAGKTSTVVELIRSLVDGQPFLGRFPVAPFDGTVALFNYEMTERRMREWLRRAGIEHPERVHVLHLRGRPMPLSSPHVRAWVAGWLRDRGAQVWVPDPYSRAYVGTVNKGNDEAQVGAFLALLDEIKAEAGVSELAMPVHSPKGARWDKTLESAIGSQRLEAWPDSIWYLGREGDSAARYFRAEGRDVDLPEGRLARDAETGRLTLPPDAPNRDEDADSTKVGKLVGLLADRGRANTSEIKEAIGVSGTVLADLVRRAGSRVTVEREGPGKPTWYALAPSPFDPQVPTAVNLFG